MRSTEQQSPWSDSRLFALALRYTSSWGFLVVFLLLLVPGSFSQCPNGMHILPTLHFAFKDNTSIMRTGVSNFPWFVITLEILILFYTLMPHRWRMVCCPYCAYKRMWYLSHVYQKSSANGQYKDFGMGIQSSKLCKLQKNFCWCGFFQAWKRKKLRSACKLGNFTTSFNLSWASTKFLLSIPLAINFVSYCVLSQQPSSIHFW